jgi:hypothetical protein
MIQTKTARPKTPSIIREQKQILSSLTKIISQTKETKTKTFTFNMMKLGTTTTYYLLLLGLVLGDAEQLRGSITRQKTGELQAPRLQKEATNKTTAALEAPTVSMQAANNIRFIAETYRFHIPGGEGSYTDMNDKVTAYW